jgi:hypothetical protein
VACIFLFSIILSLYAGISVPRKGLVVLGTSQITEAPRGLGATHIAYRTLHIELCTIHIILITKKNS